MYGEGLGFQGNGTAILFTKCKQGAHSSGDWCAWLHVLQYGCMCCVSTNWCVASSSLIRTLQDLCCCTPGTESANQPAAKPGAYLHLALYNTSCLFCHWKLECVAIAGERAMRLLCDRSSSCITLRTVPHATACSSSLA